MADTVSEKHPNRNCTATCKHEGENPDAMAKGKCHWVRCCLCMHWFHPECVSLPQDETEGVWNCASCRTIADDLSTLKRTVADDVSTLQMTITKDVSSIANDVSELKTQMTITQDVRSIANDVNELKKTVNLLLDIMRKCNSTVTDLDVSHKDLHHAVMQQTRTSAETPSQGNDAPDTKVSLLIGDSLIRNTRTKSKKLKIKSNVPKLEDVSKQLQNYDDLECVYVVNGTNNCKDMEPETVIEHFRTVIREAKKIARKVVISSITPRTDNVVTQQSVSTVNQMLVVLSNEENVTFVNNDDNFTYKNHTADKNLLHKDGYHLTQEGVIRLIANLGLQDLISCTLPPIEVNSSGKNAESVKQSGRFNRKRSENLINEIVDDESWYDKQFPPLTAPPPPPKPPTNNRKILFQGHQHPLSNFFPCTIELYGQCFSSSEAAYQYRKALEYQEWDVAEQIAQCSRANEAKKLGDGILTNQKWWDMRLSVMMEILTTKSKQCPEFKNTLMASEGNDLVEDTDHEFWARGRQGKGQNKLGHLLESLRSKAPLQTSLRPKIPYHTPRQIKHQKAWGRPATSSFKNSSDPGCGFCGERGHNSDVCGHRRPIQCRNCKGYRHKEKKCWFKAH